MIDAEDFYRRRQWLYDAMTFVIGYQKSIRGFFCRQHLSLAGLNVLDAGCGSGALVKALYDPTARFFAFDLTPAMLDPFGRWIAEHHLDNIALCQANALTVDQDLPSSWQDFDLIISSGMLEYLPKETLPAVVASFRRRLAPDGRLVLFISRDRWLNGWWLKRFWQAHLYKKQELAGVFTAAGFTDVQIFSFKTWGWAVVAKVD